MSPSTILVLFEKWTLEKNAFTIFYFLILNTQIIHIPVMPNEELHSFRFIADIWLLFEQKLCIRASWQTFWLHTSSHGVDEWHILSLSICLLQCRYTSIPICAVLIKRTFTHMVVGFCVTFKWMCFCMYELWWTTYLSIRISRECT